MRQLIDWLIFLLTGNGRIARDAETVGILDRSGQGR